MIPFNSFLLIIVVFFWAPIVAEELPDLQLPKVLYCYEYTGNDQLLHLKLNSMPFVDYFVIVELERDEDFQFTRLNFEAFSHKIIYIPFRSFPHRGTSLSEAQQRQNREQAEHTFQRVLDVMAHPQDLIILAREGVVFK